MIDLTNGALDLYILLSFYGVFIQRWALALAWRAMKTASYFGAKSAPMILAVSHVRMNAARMFAVSLATAMSLYFAFTAIPKPVSAPAQASLDGFILSAFVLVVEIVMCTVATLEVKAQLRLQKPESER